MNGNGGGRGKNMDSGSVGWDGMIGLWWLHWWALNIQRGLRVQMLTVEFSDFSSRLYYT
ncbi:hypothetical protein L211DRAFT_836888 [Terfezia boudieri ATCC MYA-4762]|uniref:Uncharacterized protein n=1 Tax=Terfezia boudieri ATCC MYA-4762 TaxID=1051890 RepID=A0A3N4M3Z3_9PEZI|nr:hypothetical protein L211DRAFT_836888 [Terfezia boudieri ATCC MYA-4762]